MKKIKAKLSARDEKLIIQALVEKRNNQLKQNRPTEPINELLIKLSKIKYITKKSIKDWLFLVEKI